MLLGPTGHLLHKVTSLRSGKVTDLYNISVTYIIHRNIQRIKQNEETEEYSPHEGIRQNPRRRTK